jgi:hypothetical protein
MMLGELGHLTTLTKNTALIQELELARRPDEPARRQLARTVQLVPNSSICATSWFVATAALRAAPRAPRRATGTARPCGRS